MRPHVIRDYKSDIKELKKVCSFAGWSENDEEILIYQPKDLSKVELFITGTVHGNEPAGFYFLKDLILNNPPENAIIVPCVNPDGYIKNTRENAKGMDLNREFRTDFGTNKEIPAEIFWIMDRLNTLNIRFKASIDMHESGREESVDDCPAPDTFYMWEISDSQNKYGKDIISELYKNQIPTCNWNKIFGDYNNNGVIYYPENMGSAEYSTAKSLDVYMKNNWTNCAMTTETSVHDSFEYRKKTLQIVLDTINFKIKVSEGLPNEVEIVKSYKLKTKRKEIV